VPSEVSYLNYEDFLRAAGQSLGINLDTVRRVASRPLAESALAAPAAGFGDHEVYPDLAVKVAVLLQRVASNHALPDGNKRTALLCAVLFANVNGLDWEPPATDDPDGAETVEVVEAAAAGAVPLAALAAWVRERLLDLPPPAPPGLPQRPALVVYPAEYIGPLPYQDHTLQIGDLVIHDVHGYNPAGVYVRRISGKTEGITVAEVIISAVGDGYAQEELDADNAEAERYPLGAKEFWRTRLVGSATYGLDKHLMTNDEFDADWAESQQQ
jgi:death on curing protein